MKLFKEMLQGSVSFFYKNDFAIFIIRYTGSGEWLSEISIACLATRQDMYCQNSCLCLPFISLKHYVRTSLYTSYSTVLMVVATVSIVTQPVELFSHRLDESIQSIIQATLMNPNFPGVITASTQGASFRGEKVIGSKFICPNRVIFCCLLTQVSKIELQTSGRNFDVGTSNFNAIT